MSRSRESKPSPKRLLATLRDFVRADTWTASRRILEEHPELLDPAAEALFGRLEEEARAQGEEEAWPYLVAHRAVLRRCREVGIEAAFGEIGETPPVPVSPTEEADHPLKRLGRQVLEGRRTLERALQEVTESVFLSSLDEAALGQVDDCVQSRLDDWRRVEENHVLAELNDAAARARPAGPALRARTALTLAEALSRLSPADAAGEIVLLDRQVELYREALRLGGAAGPNRLSAQSGLGAALRRRFARRADPADLEEAIAAFEGARERGAAAASASLGGALLERYAAGGEVSDLERAVAVLEGGLKDAPDPVEGRILLGTALQRRYAAGGEAADLERAVAVLQEAAAAAPDGSDGWARARVALSEALQARYNAHGQEGDRDAAIGAGEEVLAALDPVAFPDHIWAAAVPLVRLLFRRQGEGDWARAAEVCAAALTAAGELFLEELADGRPPAERPLLEVVSAHGYALARAGDLPAAVEAWEAGLERARAEAALREKGLSGIPDPTWREAFLSGWRRVRRMAGEYACADEARSSWAIARLVEARRDFRFLAQGLFRDLFAAPDLESIRAAAGGVPWVYRAVTPAGGLVLVVSAHEIIPTWFDPPAEAGGEPEYSVVRRLG